MFFALVIWAILCFAIGSYASSKGHSALGGFILSFLLSPLIGLIIVAMWSTNQQVLDGRAIVDGVGKRCPACAEVVKREAIKCRFCGIDLEPAKSIDPFSGA